MVKLKMTQSNSFEVNRDPAKWTRLKKAAGFLGLFCFSGIIIYCSVSENKSFAEVGDGSSRSADSGDLSPERKDIQCIAGPECDIECNGGRTTNINELLLELSENCSTITKLDLHTCNFPGSRIPKRWLKGNFTIRHFSILNCDYEEIEDEAFNTTVFYGTEVLYLNNMRVKRLTSRTFLGLTSIRDLTLTIESSAIILDNFLKPIQRTLKSFVFSFQHQQLPVQTIFGEAKMQSLKVVDLRGNAFGDSLTETAFASLPVVQSLYLSHSQIETIPEGTFRSLTGSLSLLDLSANPLTYLSPKLFEGFLGQPSFTVQLSNTRLNCDLKLLPFAEIYEKYRRNFREMVICYSPERLQGCELNSSLIRNAFISCAGATSPSTVPTPQSTEPTTASGSSATEAPTTPTAPKPPTTPTAPTTAITSTTESNGNNNNESALINLACDCCTTFNCKAGGFYPTKSFRMGEQNVQFAVEVLSFSAVRLSGLLNYSQYTIVWFSSMDGLRARSGENLGCISPFSRQEVQIQGLTPNKTYTFCLVKDTAYWISPFDCQSVYIPAEFLDTLWIGESSREFCITILAVGIISSMLFGCLCGYCFIRCKISWAARKSLDLQCHFKVNQKKKPRKRIGSDETNPVESCKSPKVHRKISTISDGSGVSYVAPNTYEVIKPETVVIDTIPLNSPPPLPKRTYTMIYQKKNNRPTKPRADSYA